MHGKHATCLVLRFGVTGHETANLRLFVAIDNQNTVNQVLQGGFDQERYNDDLILTTGSIRLTARSFGSIRLTARSCGSHGLTARFVLNARVHYGLEPFPCRIIGKHEFAQGTAIQVSIVVNKRFAERRGNFVKCGLAWCYDFTRDDVGVDDRRAELGKPVRDGGFATRDTACQANAQGRGHLKKLIRVGVPDGFTVEHGDPAGGSEIRPKRDRQLAITATQQDHGDADHGADDR